MMSYSLGLPGAEQWPLPGKTDDVIERLARATDVLDLLRRADQITPPEIDLWCALVLREPRPELYVHCPAPLSPTLALALAESMGERVAAWSGSEQAPEIAADSARFSFARLSEVVLTELSDACRDLVTQRGDRLVAVTRAVATSSNGLTLARWREVDEPLEVISWMLGSFCEEERPPAGVIDPLSGAYTREFFDETLRNELMRSERHPAELSVILLQLRRSAQMLADQRPSPRMLALTAMAMRRQLRSADIVARLDSHRMATLLPATGPRSALIAASRLGEALHNAEHLEGWSLDIGVSGMGMETLEPEELLSQATHAMVSAQQGASKHPFVYV